MAALAEPSPHHQTNAPSLDATGISVEDAAAETLSSLVIPRAQVVQQDSGNLAESLPVGLLTPPDETQSSPNEHSRKKKSESKFETGSGLDNDGTSVDGEQEDEEAHDDGGVIRCICGYTHDDGSTIQCETCSVWQHFVCMGITKATVEDRYFCETCKPRPLDRHKAKVAQAKMLQTQMHSRKRRGGGQRTRGGGRPAVREAYTRISRICKRTSNNNLRYSPVPGSTGDGAEASDESDGDEQMASGFNYEYIPVTRNEISSEVLDYLADQDFSTMEEVIVYSRAAFAAISPPATALELLPRIVLNKRPAFSGLSRYGLFLKSSVPRDRFLAEYRGHVEMQSAYIDDPLNRFHLNHLPAPHVLFDASLPICIDARQTGSAARFIRRSCRPNARLSPIVIENEPGIQYGVFSIRSIAKNSEIAFEWEWPRDHPAQKYQENMELSIEEMEQLIATLDDLIGSLECACGQWKKECAIAVMRKDIASRLKKTLTFASREYDSKTNLKHYISSEKDSRDGTSTSESMLSAREKSKARREDEANDLGNRKRKRSLGTESGSYENNTEGVPETEPKENKVFIDYEEDVLPYRQFILRQYRKIPKTSSVSLPVEEARTGPELSEVFVEDDKTVKGRRHYGADMTVDLPPPPNLLGQFTSLTTTPEAATPSSALGTPFVGARSGNSTIPPSPIPPSPAERPKKKMSLSEYGKRKKLATPLATPTGEGDARPPGS